MLAVSTHLRTQSFVECNYNFTVYCKKTFARRTHFVSMSSMSHLSFLVICYLNTFNSGWGVIEDIFADLTLKYSNLRSEDLISFWQWIQSEDVLCSCRMLTSEIWTVIINENESCVWGQILFYNSALFLNVTILLRVYFVTSVSHTCTWDQ